MLTVISKDGTNIAYDKTGQGPVIIVVNGALSHRKYPGSKDLADRLAETFTVIFFDRRGRGDSTDTKPYAVEREIEDIEALIDQTGGRAHLFGSSSGAALAFLAAQKLGPKKIIKLALYEPPYNADNAEYVGEKKKVKELIAADKTEEAITFFLEKRGMPPKALDEMKKSPEWKQMVLIGHTLTYDFEVLGDGSIPNVAAKTIAIPTLIMDGEKSFDFIHTTADSLGKLIPGAVRKTLKDQTHQASPEVLAPALKEFY